MAGVMLASQGASLGAAKPNERGVSGFLKENKSFIIGGIGLAGLAGGIAYAVHRYNTPEVVEVKFPESGKISDTSFMKEFLETVKANLDKGKAVKIVSVQGLFLTSVVNRIFSLMSSSSNIKHQDMSMKVIDADKFESCAKYDLMVRKVRKGNDKFELECIIDKSKDSKSGSKKEESSPSNSSESTSEKKESSPSNNNELGSESKTVAINNNSVDSASTDKVEDSNKMIYNRYAITVDMNDGKGERELSLGEICDILKQSSLDETSVEIIDFSKNYTVMISNEIKEKLGYLYNVCHMTEEGFKSHNLRITVQKNRKTGEIVNICTYYGF